MAVDVTCVSFVIRGFAVVVTIGMRKKTEEVRIIAESQKTPCA